MQIAQGLLLNSVLNIIRFKGKHYTSTYCSVMQQVKVWLETAKAAKQ